ncbi:MAG: hypothetical protein IH614_15400 [Desulfuromonadales bacterium]|nr:hypothetical protein [Desulfuromonadales bacterium]
MKCPVCGNRHQIEIDTHSEGFVENLQECGHCGAVWTRKGEQEIVLYQTPQAANYR